ncbi:MAG: ubiquitin family protein [Methanoculleaceae archaeon]
MVRLSMTILPGGERICCDAEEGATYQDVLMACGIIPETVLIFVDGRSIPQDEVVREGEAEIFCTASRG